ncbi:ORF70 [Agrotis segetum granulovirus]|uniref:ORF70 n=1 Tax=Agrotis segetum granulosis virus TaxID=10464 RepID=Q6QXN1_GVAS|nr:hypothetical protein AsGV084 [Agrotis segetum granulovirus]AAS82668.1 ORF70 [Agrotis segetum granulovirus]AKN63358.1 hypothetical protein AsGV084 [Agrotis segetum granulovirus]
MECCLRKYQIDWLDVLEHDLPPPKNNHQSSNIYPNLLALKTLSYQDVNHYCRSVFERFCIKPGHENERAQSHDGFCNGNYNYSCHSRQRRLAGKVHQQAE